ncbi:MAG: PKD domain-containing protein [Nocardioides sp.]
MTGRGLKARRISIGLAWGLALPVAWIASPADAAAAPGTVWEWGSNAYGQLGNGTTSASPSGAAAVPGLSNVAQVAGGREHVIALTASGTVLTWGSNQYGQLGLGDSANHSQPSVVNVGCGGGVTSVDAGHYSSFALCGDGTVRAWGDNADGQLGDGTRTNRRTPVTVQGVTDAVSIDGGRDMTYAIRADGTMLAWGDNSDGEIGDGTTTDRLTPVPVPGMTGVASIAPGRDHVLVLRQDGSVWGWGWNAYGMVGDGTTTNRTSPVQIQMSTGIQQLAAGANHSYALTTDGHVLSWGRNYLAELGDGTTTTRTRPVTVTGVSGAVSIGSGRDHGSAVLADGTVMAWGDNEQGQLGDGTTTNRRLAVVVPNVSGATVDGGGGAEYTVVLVSAGPPVNQPPHAAFSVSCTLLSCHLDGSGSTDSDGTVQAWAWTFSDGTSDSGPIVDHTFASAGTYQVTLTVTDDDQATGSSTQSVPVTDGSTSSPPVFDAIATLTNTFTSSTIRVPTQTKLGDQLLLVVTTNRAATLTTPAGWTLLGTVSDGVEVRSWTLTRTAVTGVPGSNVALALDASSKASATLVAYTGAAAPSVVQGAAETGTSTMHRAPSATVSVSGSIVVSYWADKVAAAHGWTVPTGFTQRAATAGTGSAMITSTTGDTAAQSAGTWPGATATAGASSAKAIAWTIVLPPA